MLDKAKVEELERFLEVRAGMQGMDPETIYAVGTSGAAIELTMTDLRALLRLARAVAEAERWYVDYKSAHRVELDYYDNGGQTVILLRADAVDTTAGEG